MDDILKVEFPIGSRTVVMSRPSEGQLFAITVIRKPKEGDGPEVKHRFTERIIRFLEALAGPGQWAGIEDGLLAGEIEPLQLFELFTDVTRFDWAAHARQAEAATPEPDTEPAPDARPAPRVVSGG